MVAAVPRTSRAAPETATTAPAVERPRKSVLTTETLYSKALGRMTTYTAILPASPEPGKRYPVLYLLHGAYGNYSDWTDRSRVVDFAAGRPLIIICPDGGEFGWYVDNPRIPGTNYESFVVGDLIPEVDSRFPTIAAKEARGIAGLSMGGHGALSLAAKHPELFCSASSMSGILCLTNHPDRWHLVGRFGKMPEAEANWRANSVFDLVDRFTTAAVTLYFDTGTSDATGAVKDNRMVHERLANRGIAHTYAEFPGAHSWEYWNWRIGVHLSFHLENFAARAATDRTLPETGVVITESSHRHYIRRVQKFEEEKSARMAVGETSRPVVLLGSSSIEGMKQEKLFPQYNMVNRGISADRIGIGPRGILHRLQCSVFDLNPRAVFLLNGTNDLAQTARAGTPSVEEVAACYAEVVRRIRAEIPDVTVFIVACTPTRDGYAQVSPLIARYNAMLKKQAENGGAMVHYVDTFTPSVGSDGLLKPEFSRDGLHLNGAGYELVRGLYVEAMEKAGIGPDRK
jgi:S-formylglutathione hydrolase FrmB/lysophospholipase L1-like esterase